jgi:hypothetical protein
MRDKLAKNFRLWMRQKGLRLWFVCTFLIAWHLHNAFVVTQNERQPILLSDISKLGSSAQDAVEFLKNLTSVALQELGFYQLTSANFNEFGIISTLNLFFTRLLAIYLIRESFSQFCAFVIEKTPEIEEKIKIRGSNKVTTTKSGFRNSLKKDLNSNIHCICIRIVTRGDKQARGLVNTAVLAALKLFKQHCHCEHLKVSKVKKMGLLTREPLGSATLRS